MHRSQLVTADAGDRRLPSFKNAAAEHMNAPPDRQGQRFATVAPATYDKTAHTVELVLSTGADVRRWGYIERLSMVPAAVNQDRVELGAVKVLDSHNNSDTGKIIGKIEATRFAGGRLLGTMKFASTPFGIEKEGMVERGELTSISIGYEVAVWRAVEVITDPTTGAEVTIWQAEEWTLLEVSFVSVPADPSAGVRSAVPTSGNPPANSGGAMEEEDMLTRSASGAPPPAVPSASAVTRFTPDEAITFVEMARGLGVDGRARELVAMNGKGEVGVQECRNALLRAAAERQAANTAHITGAGVAHVTGDPDEAVRGGMVEALVSRISGNAPTTDAGRQFRGMSMIDMVRYQMRQRGERGVEFMAPMEIVKRLHSTSDFPMLLTSAANRVLLAAFAAAPSVLKTLARKTTIDDFRTKYSIKLGALPELPLVPEGGEVKHLSTSESYENYKLGTYAGKFALTRQAIINDDLGAFADFTLRMAQAAVETEASNLCALLTANSGLGPTLTDGHYLFSGQHANLASEGAAIAVASLGAARLAMRTQTNLDGKTLAPTVPKTVLVGPAKETEGEAILAAINATKLEDVNPFGGKLSLAVEPRLAGNAWYVFADPTPSPVLEYAYLTGYEGPQIESREGWDILAEEFRVVLDFGCGVVDHRGVYRNAGN